MNTLPGWGLATAVGLAWWLDHRWGEPPNALHPVAWFGHVMGPVGRWVRRAPPWAAFLGGALAWWASMAVIVAVTVSLQREMAAWPVLWAIGALAVGLKPCFAWRMLRDEVAAVETALRDEGLPAARQRLSRLVSRDVSQMDAAALRETAIETLAENLNDSVVAPLFWLVVAGWPGACVYRAANTLDAMWGYRGAWEWAGKWAARADDVLSWIPARLTGWLLWPVWPWGQGAVRWRALATQAAVTPSPNGGWPMGAMALHLGVRLSKPGVYALLAEARSPQAEDMDAALQRAAVAANWAFGLAGLACAVLGTALGPVAVLGNGLGNR